MVRIIDMAHSIFYCDKKGCSNRAETLGIIKEFTSSDGLNKWQVEVNVCSEHWHDLMDE
jgi:hypothetical protein